MSYEDELRRWEQDMELHREAVELHRSILKDLERDILALPPLKGEAYGVTFDPATSSARIDLHDYTPATIPMLDALAQLLQTKAINAQHESGDGRGCSSCGYGADENWIEVLDIPESILPPPPAAAMAKPREPYQPEPAWSALCTRCLHVAQERRQGAWCDFHPKAGEKKYCDGLDETGNPCMMNARYEWYPAEL